MKDKSVEMMQCFGCGYSTSNDLVGELLFIISNIYSAEEELDKSKKKGRQGIMVVGDMRKQKKQFGARLDLESEEFIFYNL